MGAAGITHMCTTSMNPLESTVDSTIINTLVFIRDVESLVTTSKITKMLSRQRLNNDMELNHHMYRNNLMNIVIKKDYKY